MSAAGQQALASAGRRLDPALALASGVARRMVWVGGALLLASATTVAVDVIVRKAFRLSLGGADELSGYAFAIAVAWALPFALLQRANIRIDALYARLPARTAAALDVVALVALATSSACSPATPGRSSPAPGDSMRIPTASSACRCGSRKGSGSSAWRFFCSDRGGADPAHRAGAGVGRSDAGARACRSARHPGGVRRRGRLQPHHRPRQGRMRHDPAGARPSSRFHGAGHSGRRLAGRAGPGAGAVLFAAAARARHRRGELVGLDRFPSRLGADVHPAGRDPAALGIRRAHVRGAGALGVVAAGRADAFQYRRLRAVRGHLRVRASRPPRRSAPSRCPNRGASATTSACSSARWPPAARSAS